MRIRYDFSKSRTGKFRRSPTTNKHRVEIPKMVREVIRTSDIVLEILDARFIDKTRNIDMEKHVLENSKKLIFILNKSDLIDVSELKRTYDFETLKPYVLFSCKSKIGRSRLRDLIKIQVKRLKLGDKTARIGVIGYPNTGKSSIINLLSGRKGTGTSSEAGFTKKIQKIRFSRKIVILDTPGVFLESEQPHLSSIDLKKHAKIGIKTFDKVKNPDFIVADIMRENPGKLEKFYSIKANGDVEFLLDELGIRKNFLRKGGKIDIERTARSILKDWQESKIN